MGAPYSDMNEAAQVISRAEGSVGGWVGGAFKVTKCSVF